MTLQELRDEVDKRLYKLQVENPDAYSRCEGYINNFWNDAASLAEFIEDYDKGVYT